MLSIIKRFFKWISDHWRSENPPPKTLSHVEFWRGLSYDQQRDNPHLDPYRGSKRDGKD